MLSHALLPLSLWEKALGGLVGLQSSRGDKLTAAEGDWTQRGGGGDAFLFVLPCVTWVNMSKWKTGTLQIPTQGTMISCGFLSTPWLDNVNWRKADLTDDIPR